VDNFKRADLVQLKSGGPLMTVTGIRNIDDPVNGVECRCSWFNAAGDICCENFPAVCLVPAIIVEMVKMSEDDKRRLREMVTAEIARHFKG
jgi:uncharacterized protein YodC (DUF2158 family)